MNHSETYHSQAYNLRDLLTSATWELHTDHFLRTSKRHITAQFPYSRIDAIRLCFHMGGRGSAAKFCCYFSINGHWNNKQMLSSANSDTKTEDYKTYRNFVVEFIRRIKQSNPAVRLIIGHSQTSWLFYLATVVFLLCVPIFTYRQHISSGKESFWIGLVLLLLSSPLVASLVKYFPKALQWGETIPESVLPTPKTP